MNGLQHKKGFCDPFFSSFRPGFQKIDYHSQWPGKLPEKRGNIFAYIRIRVYFLLPQTKSQSIKFYSFFFPQIFAQPCQQIVMRVISRTYIDRELHGSKSQKIQTWDLYRRDWLLFWRLVWRQGNSRSRFFSIITYPFNHIRLPSNANINMTWFLFVRVWLYAINFK